MDELLATQPFLAGMTRHQVEQLARCARDVAFHANQRVFTEGGKADRFWLLREGFWLLREGFWLLREGEVVLDLQTPSRGPVVIETLTDGAVLGWSWLFPPQRWQFGAVAVRPTAAVEFDGVGVRQLCETDAQLGRELAQRFMAVVVDRLQHARKRGITMSATKLP